MAFEGRTTHHFWSNCTCNISFKWQPETIIVFRNNALLRVSDAGTRGPYPPLTFWQSGSQWGSADGAGLHQPLHTHIFLISNSRKILNSAKVLTSHTAYNRKNHRTPKTTLDASSKEKCVHASCLYCTDLLPLNPHYEFSRKTCDKQQRESSVIYVLF